MAKPDPGDQQNFDDGELEHGWAVNTIDLAVERQTTSLREDPKQRRLVIGGVVGCVLLIGLTIGVAARGGAEASAAPPVVVQDEQPEAASAEPAVEPPPLVVAKRPDHKRGEADRPAPGPKRPTSDKPAGPKTATATQTDPPSTADSAAAPDELPDVEQWDDADDDALREQGDKPIPPTTPPGE